MKRILIFGMNDNPGGIESFLINYVRKFDRNELKTDFLCNTAVVAYEEELKKLGCSIYRITSRSQNAVKYRTELRNFFEKKAKDYDIIWVNLCSLANMDYLVMAKKYDIPVRIIHSHNSRNMDSRLRGILHSINKRRIEKYATDFWACSDTAAEWFYPAELRKKKEIKIVHNAVDVLRFRFDSKKRSDIRQELNAEDKIVIGHVGRLHFQKNQMFLLDIFSEFLGMHDNSVLLLVGQGEDREKLQEKVKQLGIQDKVNFLGVRKDVPELLMGMDVFAFPSLFEGLSVVAMEVQASGLPIVAEENVIPDHAIAGEAFYKCSLNRSSREWAELIDKAYRSHKDDDRTAAAECVRKINYDINTEAPLLEKWFSEAGAPHKRS